MMDSPEGGARVKMTHKILEKIIAENFPNLTKNFNQHIKKVQRTPTSINSKIDIHTYAHQHIIVIL